MKTKNISALNRIKTISWLESERSEQEVQNVEMNEMYN